MRYIEHDKVIEIILKSYYCQSCWEAAVADLQRWPGDAFYLQIQLQFRSGWPTLAADPEARLLLQRLVGGQQLVGLTPCGSRLPVAASQWRLLISQAIQPWLTSYRKMKFQTWEGRICLLGPEAIVRRPWGEALPPLAIGTRAAAALLVLTQPGRRSQGMQRGRDVTGEATSAAQDWQQTSIIIIWLLQPWLHRTFRLHSF